MSHSHSIAHITTSTRQCHTQHHTLRYIYSAMSHFHSIAHITTSTRLCHTQHHTPRYIHSAMSLTAWHSSIYPLCYVSHSITHSLHTLGDVTYSNVLFDTSTHTALHMSLHPLGCATHSILLCATYARPCHSNVHVASSTRLCHTQYCTLHYTKSRAHSFTYVLNALRHCHKP